MADYEDLLDSNTELDGLDPRTASAYDDILSRRERNEELLVRVRKMIDDNKSSRDNASRMERELKPRVAAERTEADYLYSDELFFGQAPQGSFGYSEPEDGIVHEDMAVEEDMFYSPEPDFSYTGGGVFGLDIGAGVQPDPDIAGERSFRYNEPSQRYTEHNVIEDEFHDLLEDDTPEHTVRVTPRNVTGIGYYRTEHNITRDIPSMYSDEEIERLALDPSVFTGAPKRPAFRSNTGARANERDPYYYDDILSDGYEPNKELKAKGTADDFSGAESYDRSLDYDSLIPYDDSTFGLKDVSAGEESLYMSYLDDDGDLVSELERELGYESQRGFEEEIREGDFEGEELLALDGTELTTREYDRHSLALYLKESEKRVDSSKRSIRKLSGRTLGTNLVRDVENTVIKLNYQKSIVDERCSALNVICRGGFKSYIKRYRKLLLNEINEYNAIAAEYETVTGYTLVYASRSIPDDIAAGRPYQKLPNVNFVNEELDLTESAPRGKMSKSERRAFHREQLRLAKESEREEKRIKKLARGKGEDERVIKSAELADIGRKIDKSVNLINARTDGRIAEYKKQIDLTEYTFSVKQSDKRHLINNYKLEAKRTAAKRKDAVKAERYDAERYYSALLMTPDSVKNVKKRSKRDRLESLHMRLEALLAERERVDEQLVKLYTGGTEKKDKINRGLLRARRRTAKKIKRCFMRDMKILDKKIPLDVKEKIVKCCNKIIATEVENTDLRYRLRHNKLQGRAKYDAKYKIKENKRALRRYYKDYRRFLKRGGKYVERLRGTKIQIAWVLGTLIAVGIIVWLYFYVNGML